MLSINISEVIWAVINFFLLYFLLKKFLYTPVIRFMDERKARIDAGLAKEQQASAEMTEAARQNADALAGKRAEAAALLGRMSDENDKRRDAVLTEAKDLERERRKENRTLAEQEARQAQESLQTAISGLGASLAQHLLTDDGTRSHAPRADAGMPATSRNRGWVVPEKPEETLEEELVIRVRGRKLEDRRASREETAAAGKLLGDAVEDLGASLAEKLLFEDGEEGSAKRADEGMPATTRGRSWNTRRDSDRQKKMTAEREDS